jgi:hypothetical protein
MQMGVKTFSMNRKDTILLVFAPSQKHVGTPRSFAVQLLKPRRSTLDLAEVTTDSIDFRIAGGAIVIH